MMEEALLFPEQSDMPSGGEYSDIVIDAGYLCRAELASKGSSSIPDVGYGVVGRCVRMVQILESSFLSSEGRVWLVFGDAGSLSSRMGGIDPDFQKSGFFVPKAFRMACDMFQLVALHYSPRWRIVSGDSFISVDFLDAILRGSMGRTLLFSDDMMWSGFLSGTVDVTDIGDGKDFVRRTLGTETERLGFIPSIVNITAFLGMYGCHGYWIPKGITLHSGGSVKGIPSKFASQIVARYCDGMESSIDGLQYALAHVYDMTFMDDCWKSAFIDCHGRVILNCRMLALNECSDDDLEECSVDSAFNPMVLHALYKSMGVDIMSLDPRVSQYFVKEEQTVTEDNFFEYDTPDRA